MFLRGIHKPDMFLFSLPIGKSINTTVQKYEKFNFINLTLKRMISLFHKTQDLSISNLMISHNKNG